MSEIPCDRKTSEAQMASSVSLQKHVIDASSSLIAQTRVALLIGRHRQKAAVNTNK